LVSTKLPDPIHETGFYYDTLSSVSGSGNTMLTVDVYIYRCTLDNLYRTCSFVSCTQFISDQWIRKTGSSFKILLWLTHSEIKEMESMPTQICNPYIFEIRCCKSLIHWVAKIIEIIKSEFVAKSQLYFMKHNLTLTLKKWITFGDKIYFLVSLFFGLYRNGKNSRFGMVCFISCKP